MTAPRKLLHWCGHCRRVEFVIEAGPLFVRCVECFGLTDAGVDVIEVPGPLAHVSRKAAVLADAQAAREAYEREATG